MSKWGRNYSHYDVGPPDQAEHINIKPVKTAKVCGNCRFFEKGTCYSNSHCMDIAFQSLPLTTTSACYPNSCETTELEHCKHHMDERRVNHIGGKKVCGE